MARRLVLAARDDRLLYILRKAMSGGQNSRQDQADIAESQFTLLYNADIGIPGRRRKRPGLTLIGNDVGNDAVTGLRAYYPIGGTPILLMTEGVNVRKWEGSGNWSAALDSGFTTGLRTTIMGVGESGEGDVVILQNETENAHRMNASDSFQDLGDTNTSPPKSRVNCYFRNRWWTYKEGLLSFSDAYPADYSAAFDRTTDAFRIKGDIPTFLFPIRDSGILIGNRDSIWSLSPSLTPDPTTDKPQPESLEFGCMAPNCVCQVGDDIYFLARDGIRSLKRTQQDKLQFGVSYPLSYPLKDEFDDINWAQISKACMIYFNNMILFSYPSGTSTYNDRVWVYYPATNGWMVITGWNIANFATFRVNGEERLYGGDATDGKVYRCWYGYDDNGVAINYQEESRAENFATPQALEVASRYKIGQELEIRALTSGDYDIAVYVSIDRGGWQSVGTFNIAGDSPALPVALPFTLAEDTTISQKFHLDDLGRFRDIKTKLQHNALNSGDEIVVLEHSITALLEEAEGE